MSPQNSARVGIVHPQKPARPESGAILGEGSDPAAAGKEAVGHDCPALQAMNFPGEVERASVTEESGFETAELGGVLQAGVRAPIDQDVRQVESLSDGEIGEITVGNENGSLGAEEFGGLLLDLVVERMITGGFARGADVQAE